MTLWLCVLVTWYRQKLPRWLPWAALGTLVLVLLQGLLGGLTVTQLLRFDIVTAHLGTALLFFCAVLTMGAGLLPYQATGTVGKLPWLSLMAAVLVYGQSLLGGLVASRWAAHQCFGLAELCQVMNSHIVGVVPPALATLGVVLMAWRTPALHLYLRQLANWSGVCLVAQIVLGIATFRLRLQVEPLTVAHQLVGAMLLGTLVCFSVLAWRDRIWARTWNEAPLPSVGDLT